MGVLLSGTLEALLVFVLGVVREVWRNDRERRRPLGVRVMCQKRQRRCAALLAIREEAFEEWCRADSYHDVLAAWGRLGRRVTLHRYGREHYAELAKLARRRRVAE